MADDSATIVVNPLPPRRRDIVIAHLAAPTAGAEFFYFIEDSGEIATSPIRAGDFVSLLASGQVTPSTLVWAQSLGEWTALRNVPALASMVAQADVMAPSDETNDPDETIEAAPREPNETNETIQAAPRHVFVCDNSTLLEVAWCFVFGVAAIPILVISIVVGLSGFMFVYFFGSFFPFLFFPPFGPVIISCSLFPIVVIKFFIDWIFGHFYNANSNPSRCVAFWSGISLFVVAVVLSVLRRRA